LYIIPINTLYLSSSVLEKLWLENAPWHVR
jgi:hypothetical protein